jgi:hypothetical protein
MPHPPPQRLGGAGLAKAPAAPAAAGRSARTRCPAAATPLAPPANVTAGVQPRLCCSSESVAPPSAAAGPQEQPGPVCTGNALCGHAYRRMSLFEGLALSSCTVWLARPHQLLGGCAWGLPQANTMPLASEQAFSPFAGRAEPGTPSAPDTDDCRA